MKNNLTRRKHRSLESRKKLFETASQMILKKGFDNVTIDDICTKLGVSKSLFYHFYYSKEDIMIEQFQYSDAAYKKIVEEKLNNYSGIDKLLQFTKYQYKYVKSSFMGKDFLKTVYRTSIMNSEMAHSLTNEKRYLYKFIYATIKEAQDKKELPSHLSTKKIASQILILMRGMFYNWCLYDRGFRFEETNIDMISTFLNGLKHKVT